MNPLKAILVIALVGWPWMATSALGQTSSRTDPSPTSNKGCSSDFYPVLAMRLNHEGETTLSFNVSVDGKIEDLRVIKSSGYTELDQAAMVCASGWLYKPASIGGRPIEAPWKAKVGWVLNRRGPAIAPGGVPPHPKAVIPRCSNFPSSDEDPKKVTFVQLRVTKDGHVEDAFAAKSSGDPDFDTRAVECVSGIDYEPGLIGGEKADWPWGTAISWVEYAGFMDFEGAGKWHVCKDDYYPPEAKVAKLEATAKISLSIMPVGDVRDVHVDSSSGNPSLDQAAITCAGLWKYNRLLTMPQVDRKQVAQIFWKDGHVFVFEQTTTISR